MKYKISIILPIYNVDKFLPRCMESLLSQTLDDIEIIMVDDESPDSCPQLCDEYEYKYQNIKVIHKKNDGLGYARNSGLTICEGEYVAFVDSDDFVDIHMFEDLYNYAKANSLDACFCGYHIWKDNRHDVLKQEKYDYEVCYGKHAVRKVLLDMVGSKPESHSDVTVLSSMWKGIYSLEVIKNNNLQFVSERQYIAEDIIFHCDFMPCCIKVGFVPGCYYYYCDNGTSLTRAYKSDRFEKELFLFKTIGQKLKAAGFSEVEYKNRLDRYLLLKIRSCISQQYAYIGIYGYKRMKNAVDFIVNNREVREFCKRYPYKKLDIKHWLFFIMVKYKLVHILFFLNKIQKL